MEERTKKSVKVLKKKKGNLLRSVSLNCIFLRATYLAQRCFLSPYGTHLKVERGKTLHEQSTNNTNLGQFIFGHKLLTKII